MRPARQPKNAQSSAIYGIGIRCGGGAAWWARLITLFHSEWALGGGVGMME